MHDNSKRKRVSSRFAEVDGTVWPVNLTGDEDTYGLEHRLRYSPEALTREDQLVLASVVASYVHLTSGHLTHGEAFVSLRRARKATRKSRPVSDNSWQEEK
jgi:hypothetical protein